MYKVFINDNPIVITQNEDVFNQSSFGIKIRYYSPDVIPDIIELMKTSPKNAVILHSQPEVVMSAFKNSLLYIQAAGGIVFNGKKELLMIKRYERWDLPKGKIEPSENPQNAAIREVEEECGIDGLTIIKPLSKTFHCYDYKGKMAIKETHWYLMKCETIKSPSPQSEEGITEVKWSDPATFFNSMKNTYNSISDFVDVSLQDINQHLN